MGKTMSHIGTHGVVYPDELRILESVFEKACRTSKITRDSAEAERIALKIMLLFCGQLLEAAIKLPNADEDQDENLKCS
jgi:hypothetical protein